MQASNTFRQNPISHKMQNLGCWAQFYHNKSLQIIEEMLSLLIVELQFENVTHVYEPNKAKQIERSFQWLWSF